MRSFRSSVGSSLLLALAAATCLGTAGMFFSAHLREIASVHETVLPLLASVSALENRRTILREQVEVAELDAALKTGSQMERVRVSVLPATAEMDRAIATFELLRTALDAQGLLGSMSAIDVQTERSRDGDFAALPFTVTFTVRGDGARRLLSFVRLAGLVTVGDALTPAEKRTLIRVTEEENPAGVIALEQFFGTDLLAYAAEPRAFEAQLTRSLQSEGFLSAFRAALQTSLLQEAKTLFQGSLGEKMAEAHLWPTGFMAVDKIALIPGAVPDWYTVRLNLSLLRRASSGAS